MKLHILAYNDWHDVTREESVMPKMKIQDKESFGKRMARLRQAAGYSQRELAAETGVSQRMIAYYESKSQHPPTHLLPIIAKALGVTADQLLGMERMKRNGPQTRGYREGFSSWKSWERKKNARSCSFSTPSSRESGGKGRRRELGDKGKRGIAEYRSGREDSFKGKYGGKI